MAIRLTGMIDSAGDSQLILLRGAGGDFCLGRDTMGRSGGAQPEALEQRARTEPIFDFYGSFRRSPIPVVGVVQGRAVGFGCAMAALCDITLASDAARFQLPEMGHNIMPTIAMSSLVDRLQRKAIMYLVYSAAEVDARTALAYGLASQVFAAAELDGAVEELVSFMTGCPPAATLAVKEYARSATTMDIRGATDFARNLHATINTSSGMRG